MRLRRLLPIVAALVLVMFGTRLLDDAAPAPTPSAQPAPPVARTAPWDRTDAPAASSSSTATSALVVQDVTVRDMDGRVAWRGDVDLAPVLARIENGERDSHRNDVGVFGNREGLLPARANGYYREYVVRTPGIDHAGPQRVIIGREGEVFYTPDHYASFQRIR